MAKRPVRAVELAGAVAQHRLIDRLIRGRAWIGVLAFALIGIVAMQLCLLKLNSGIGRAIEHEGLLQRQNTALRIENSEASSGDRVEQLAAAEGMGTAAPGTEHFLAARGPMDTRLAAAALAKPVKAPTPAASVPATGEITSAAAVTEAAPATGNAATSASTATTAAGTTPTSTSTPSTTTTAAGLPEGTAPTGTTTSPSTSASVSTPSASTTTAPSTAPSGSATVSPTVGGTQASSGG